MRGASAETRQLWVFGGLAIVGLVICAAMAAWFFNQTQTLTNQHAKLTGDLKKLTEAVDKEPVPQLQEENVHLDEQLQMLEQDLPIPDYIPTLLTDLQDDALTTRNEILEFRKGLWTSDRAMPGAPTKPEEGAGAGKAPAAGGATAAGAAPTAKEQAGPKYDTVEIRLKVRGSYQSAFDLLKRFGTWRKMLEVKEIQITRQSGMRPDNLTPADVGLTLLAYVVPPPSGFPGKMVADSF